MSQQTGTTSQGRNPDHSVDEGQQHYHRSVPESYQCRHRREPDGDSDRQRVRKEQWQHVRRTGIAPHRDLRCNKDQRYNAQYCESTPTEQSGSTTSHTTARGQKHGASNQLQLRQELQYDHKYEVQRRLRRTN